MNHNEYIEMGLNGEAPLKVIMGASIENVDDDKVGVVSILFATMDKTVAENRINTLMQENPNNYYMVYSVPLDTDLSTLTHYPSIAVTKDDLK